MSFSCCRKKIECDGCGDCLFPDGLCYEDDEGLDGEDYEDEEDEDEEDL